MVFWLQYLDCNSQFEDPVGNKTKTAIQKWHTSRKQLKNIFLHFLVTFSLACSTRQPTLWFWIQFCKKTCWTSSCGTSWLCSYCSVSMLHLFLFRSFAWQIFFPWISFLCDPNKATHIFWTRASRGKCNIFTQLPSLATEVNAAPWSSLSNSCSCSCVIFVLGLSNQLLLRIPTWILLINGLKLLGFVHGRILSVLRHHPFQDFLWKRQGRSLRAQSGMTGLSSLWMCLDQILGATEPSSTLEL